ncbi:MAG: PD-(D/E)XK nuclease family protein, partial [Lachnospiraceae bacterium]|nr:PD-(D/E)XK nuclease family protein [Lachnospiraceae bacterium]
AENENLVLNSSDRNKYFIVRMARILTRTVQTLTGQAKKGSFRTAEFEKEFTEDGFKGRIDRIDTTEKGQKLYVSIIDYKSGNKPFELSRVLYALDMQLVVYLNAAMKIEKIEHPKMEIKPAGIFYYHIDDPVVKASDAPSGTAEEASQKIREALRLRGIVNDDDEVIGMFDSDMGSKSEVIPVGVKKDGSFTSASSILAEDGFKVMADYVNKKSAAMKAEISDGSVKKAPAKYDGVLSCDYCSYRDVCYFDERRRGFEARKLSKVKDSGEIIDLMKKFCDGDEK